MNEINVKIALVRDRAKIPAYATDGSAALDLRYAADEPMTILPGERRLVPTGIAISPETKNVAALVCARSGLASKKGLTLANGIGVVDSDYRGEIMAAMINLGNEPYTIEPDERVAQLMFVPVLQAKLIEAETLDETARGTGGFGSTGTK